MEMPELWESFLSGEYHLAKQMINRGANLNELTTVKIGFKTTLLHYAVYKKRHVECIRVLLNLGADINARDSLGLTPLHGAAATANDPDLVEMLINEGAIVDARDTYQMTAFHHSAARKGTCTRVAQKLIARGASLKAGAIHDRTALHIAVIRCNLEMVKLLIRHGVNIDAKDIHGNTPLLLSFRKEKPDLGITQLLLDNGADVNSKAHDTGFSLLYAAKSNRLDCIQLLLERGARVNEATREGYTALHTACWAGVTNVTALLLKFGAHLNARSHKGMTPFELLPNSPSSEATAQIIIREAIKREALGQFLCEEYTRMVQFCENYSKFDQECREEVKRMQSEKIDIEDSAISFFYILSIEEEKLTALARHENIVREFESSGYVASFRIYADELTRKFEVAKKRANLPARIVRKLAAYVKYGYIK